MYRSISAGPALIKKELDVCSEASSTYDAWQYKLLCVPIELLTLQMLKQPRWKRLILVVEAGLAEIDLYKVSHQNLDESIFPRPKALQTHTGWHRSNENEACFIIARDSFSMIFVILSTGVYSGIFLLYIQLIKIYVWKLQLYASLISRKHDKYHSQNILSYNRTFSVLLYYSVTLCRLQT